MEPRTVPTKAPETVTPSNPGERANLSLRARVVPAITAVSNPKSRPPSAATSELWARKANGLRNLPCRTNRGSVRSDFYMEHSKKERTMKTIITSAFFLFERHWINLHSSEQIRVRLSFFQMAIEKFHNHAEEVLGFRHIRVVEKAVE